MDWSRFITLLVLSCAWSGVLHTPITNYNTYNCTSSWHNIEKERRENETIITCNGTEQYRVGIFKDKYYNLYCISASNITVDLITPQSSTPLGALEKYFIFMECPSPSTSYADTMKQLGVTSVREIKIRNVRPYINLTRTHLEGLEELKVENLNLYDSSLRHIEEDAFEAVPNLIKLELSFNHGLRLPAEIFRPLQQLTELRLSYMGLQELPKLHLPNLKVLYLGRNSLRLTSYTFKGATNLETLDMSSNKMTNLTQNVLNPLIHLREIDLSYNNIATLSSDVFEFNKVIEVINLTGNNLIALPDNLFSNLKRLNELNLFDNKLQYISKKIFFHSGDPQAFNNSLKVLNLSTNDLKTLPTTIFKSLRFLETLHLDHNQINILEREHFEGLTGLITLNINSNRLSAVDFPLDLNIKYLDASSNQFCDWRPFYQSNFSNLQHLEILNLHNNSIRHIHNDWKFDLNNLTVLNISLNKIEGIQSFEADLDFDKEQALTVDLSYNRISFVDLADYEKLITKTRTYNVSVHLTGNPLICDCHLHPFFVYSKMTSTSTNGIKFITENTYCDKPQSLTGRYLATVHDEELTCEQVVNDTCVLSLKPSRSARVLDCSNGSLNAQIYWDALPDFINSTGRQVRLEYNHTELVLENNDLKTLQVVGKLHNNVTVLKLRGNQLNLNVGDIPDQIEELDLRHNNLGSIKDPVAKMIVGPRPRKLKISNNPLECNCDNIVFLSLLQHHNNTFIVEDLNEIWCSNNRSLLETRLAPLCDANSTAVVVVSVLAALVVVVTIIYCRYRVAMKAYLVKNYPQTRRYLLKYVPVNDCELKYDVFISHSHLNEEDVTKMNEFLQKMNYVTYVHGRDWKGGESILEAIDKSVRESQTSIFFVTLEFVQSEWSRHEFRVAFSRQVLEVSPNIIVVIKGNIDAIARKDRNIRNYIKMFTYLKWEDPSFENRLILALPEILSTESQGNKWNNMNLSQVNVVPSKDATNNKEQQGYT